MLHMMIRHQVENFDSWYPVFENHRSAREEAGLRDAYLLRDTNDPARVVILFEAEDADRAKAFADSPELREAMTQAGVVGAPEISFLDEV